MKRIEHFRDSAIFLFLSVLTLACPSAATSRSHAFTQVGTSYVSVGDSIEFVPLQKFDFGSPNPHACNSKSAQPVDYLKFASPGDLEHIQSETALLSGRSGYPIMALSESVDEYAVGQIPYQEIVTAYGGRMYDVPIMITPSAKFSHQISLQYNSQAGNGLAGFGWNIGGLSSITIANKTLYYNGESAPADINDTDAVYMLDNIPLVQNENSSLSAEYPLETARGHIIVKKHMSGNVISYFTVLYPDGSKATYGMPSNTTAKASYPLTLMEDNLGNQIAYTYNRSFSDYIISSILFTNSRNVCVGRLTFSYSSRTDAHLRYHACQASCPNWILKSITSESAGDNLCTYRLTHELRDGVNLLTSIGCSNSSGEQLRPLSFAYGNVNGSAEPSNDFTKSDNLFLSTYFPSSSDIEFVYDRGKYLPGSYNDGLVILPIFSTYDIVAKKKKGIKQYTLFGSKYDAEQEVLVAPKLNYLSRVDNSITVGEGFQYVNAADVDGDGVDEIVKVNFNGTSTSSSTTALRITIYGYVTSTGAIAKKKTFDVTVNGIVKDGDFVSPMWRCYHIGDFKGDGSAQLLTISYNEDPFSRSCTSYASLINLASGDEISETALLSLGVKDELFCIDIDGDGRTEVCHATTSGLNVYNLNRTTFSFTKALEGVTSADLSAAEYYFLDVNGDGYVDIARRPAGASSDWYLYRNTGRKFSPEVITLQGTGEGDSYMFFDVNKDGLPDLVSRNGTAVSVYLNVNGTFKSTSKINSKLTFSEKARFVPYNMMGYNVMSDFIAIEDGCVNLYEFSQDLSSSRLLTRFTNSLGATTVNNYANLAYSNYVYVTDENRTYYSANGYAKCRFPLPLLYNTQKYLNSSLSKSDEVSNLWYTYFDACIHTRGLGFCGFGKMRTTDYGNSADKEPVTIETRNPENMGVTTRLVHGHRMTQDNPYDITDYTYDKNATYYPRVTEVIHVDTLTTLKSTTSYAYDTYDYPISVTEQKVFGHGSKFEESRNIKFLHKETVADYRLGTILSDTRTKTIPAKRALSDSGTIKDFGSEFADVQLIASDNAGSIGKIDTVIIVKPILPPDEIVVSYSHWLNRQTFTYDDKGLPISRIDYVGDSSDKLNRVAETRWTYDADGNVLTEKSAPYDVAEFVGKSYTYDDDGTNLLTETNELGQTKTFSNYNKFGKPQTITDHKGRETTNEYDDWGELKASTLPEGCVSSISRAWGGIGCYMETTAASGKPEEVVHYYALGREVRRGTLRFDGQWIYVDRIYGRNGQVQKISLPFRNSSGEILWNIYEYDEYARPVAYVKASGCQTSWMYDENNTTETRNGVWSTRTIDANGQVIMVQDAGGTISYTLRADGQPSKVSVNGGLNTTFEYDVYGRRTKIIDPSAGTQTDGIVFNKDGSFVSTHTNPNGSVVTYGDKYGRTSKVERLGEYATDYRYGPDGLLISETSSNGTSKTYSYDGYDRMITVRETVPDGKWLKRTFSYTSDGNVGSVSYESQNGVIASEEFEYSNGTNVGISLNGTPVRLVNNENELGQPTSVSTGEITRTYSYDAYGMQYRRTMGDVMDCTYSFDLLTGNLLNRTDNLRNQTETFGYDELNRLTSIDDRRIMYSANGNIIGIDAVGSMSYGESSRPYQVTSLALDEGVVLPRAQTISYTCYSRPSIIVEDGRSAAFTYNGDGDRVKMNVSEGASPVLSRYYIGDRYELDVTPDGTVERLYLGGDAYSAPAVYVKEGTGDWTFYNIGRDYLGNITHIATSDGTLVEENSYDPWGRLRDPEDWEIYAPGTEPELMLGRGYTGHEHLTWFGLINMNARLYDPVLGRFLSPDPFVQMPDFTQNFNRYSYCLNNPLVYVDENGEYIVIDSFFVGLFGGGWKRAKQMAKNDLKIWGGIFATDHNKTFFGRVIEFYSRLTWQLPQTTIGFLTAHTFNTCRLFGGVENVRYLYGATVVNTYGDGVGQDFVAVTQGSYVVGDNELSADPANALFQHEYGHYIQSKSYGPLYYEKVGIPSLFSKNTTYSPHCNNPVEQDANLRALKYYCKNGLETLWNNEENKILVYEDNNYDEADRRFSLGNILKLKWYDFFTSFIQSCAINIHVSNSKY